MITAIRARANSSRASFKGDEFSDEVPYICVARLSTAATSGGAESSRSSSKAFGGGAGAWAAGARAAGKRAVRMSLKSAEVRCATVKIWWGGLRGD